MDNRLMPCPFCGNHVIRLKEDIDGYNAHCIDCMADGPWGAMEIQAIDRWNTRATIITIKENDAGPGYNRAG